MVPIIFHPDVRRMLWTMKALAEAGRAICLTTAMAIDRARHGETQAERVAAKAREELLTPIAKAWSTDAGVEAASLGVQVHGGMGFIEETGAAQYYRDARIAPIYEGTNGIQAIDLVGRKLALENGEAVRRHLNDAREIAAACERDPELASIGQELARATRAADSATAWLQERMRAGKPNDTQAGATPYLKMMGLLTGAQLLAKGAIVARKQGSASNHFLATRIAVARFFAEQLLPQSEALLAPITRGVAGPLEDAEALAH